MKYSFLFLLLVFPIFSFAGTGETIQVQGFYAALGAILILFMFQGYPFKSQEENVR